MLFHLFESFRNLLPFTASYSNQVFKELLKKEEEEECIKKMQQGDHTARDLLIEHNLRLVAHIVKKFDYKNIDQDDLISVGTIGLIKGVDTFLSSKGNRLTTYCAKCIQNEILMYFRANNKNNRNISLNESVGFDKEGNEISILDILKAPRPDFLEEIQLKDDVELLNKYLKVLTDRERDIIVKRYGLMGNKEQTQKMIASNMHISRSYVSRIEKRALTKILREFIKNNNYNAMND